MPEDIPEPPAPDFLVEPPVAEPVTAEDVEGYVSVTVHEGRLTEARVDPRAPRERLGPAIVEAVNTALEQPAGRARVSMADLVGALAQSDVVMRTGLQHSAQIMSAVEDSTRALQQQLEHAEELQHRNAGQGRG